MSTSRTLPAREVRHAQSRALPSPRFHGAFAAFVALNIVSIRRSANTTMNGIAWPDVTRRAVSNIARSVHRERSVFVDNAIRTIFRHAGSNEAANTEIVGRRRGSAPIALRGIPYRPAQPEPRAALPDRPPCGGAWCPLLQVGRSPPHRIRLPARSSNCPQERSAAMCSSPTPSTRGLFRLWSEYCNGAGAVSTASTPASLALPSLVSISAAPS